MTSKIITAMTACTKLTLSPTPRFNYEEMGNRLIAILDDLADNEDSTSKEIFNWGMELMENVLNDDHKDEATLLRSLAKKIEEFKATILSIDTLNSPSFETDPSKPSATEIFSLIQEVSAYTNTLELSFLAPTNHELVTFSAKQISPEETFMIKWQEQELAKKQKKIAKEQQKRKWMNMALLQLDDYIEASKKETAMILYQKDEQIKQHELELATRFEEMKDLYSGQITGLKNKISDLEVKYKEDLSIRDKQIKLIDKTNETVTKATNVQVDLLKSQQEKTFIAVDTQIKNTTEACNSEIQSVKSTCQRQLDVQSSAINNLQSKLRSSEQKNYENERKNSANEARLRALEYQLGRAQDELYESSSCIIL